MQQGPLFKPNQDGKFCALINPQIIFTISGRRHKNMSLDYGDTTDVLNNRRIFLESLGIDYRQLVCAQQVHASSIRYVTAEDLGKGALAYDTALPNTDTLITNQKNIPLAIFTADCLPVFLSDPKTPAIGLIHAGWRSSRENITAKTIQAMQDKFNTQPKDLSAGFGPSLRRCCYQVGKEFRQFFPDVLMERDGDYYLDLARVNKKQLLALGVKEENIFDSQICTICLNEDFFSFRKEGNASGRMMSVMMLR